MMSLSLYDVAVGTYSQMLVGASQFLERARAHAVESGADPDALLEARLAPDMFPLNVQAVTIGHHSAGALRALKSGKAGVPTRTPPATYAEMQEFILEARKLVEAASAAEINALEDAEIVFEVRDLKLPFTGRDFILSFSLPNFYFHLTTAYDILRAQGAPVGKLDYLGPLRMKA